jgi:hypothetical protein
VNRRVTPRSLLDGHSVWRGIALILHIAGIESAGRLKAQDLCLLVGAGAMLNAARHDDTFSRTQGHDMITKLDAEPAAPDHEELVLVLVMVPREFALNLHKFDLWPFKAAIVFGRQ